jgi:hypothetical protein
MGLGIDLWEVEYMPSAGIQLFFFTLTFLPHLQRREVREKETTKKIPGSAIERNQHSCTRILEILAFWREKLGKAKPDLCFCLIF